MGGELVIIIKRSYLQRKGRWFITILQKLSQLTYLRSLCWSWSPRKASTSLSHSGGPLVVVDDDEVLHDVAEVLGLSKSKDEDELPCEVPSSSRDTRCSISWSPTVPSSTLSDSASCTLNIFCCAGGDVSSSCSINWWSSEVVSQTHNSHNNKHIKGRSGSTRWAHI